MKGGYQILDLTGATAGSPVEVKGIYKAAAGNNGKPVMVLTNDGQRVYAEIAEDDGDYITCYISAEGKTVNITIKSDDSVTTVISDPGASITGLEQAVNELNSNLTERIVASVTSDGTQTYNQLISQLSSAYNRLSDNEKRHSKLIVGTLVVPQTTLSTFGCVTLAGGSLMRITGIQLSSTSYWHRIDITDTGTVSNIDVSASIPSTGTVISLVVN